jgi:hypothetical protein
MRESDLERQVKIWASHNGWLSMKYTGERGYPDRIFIKNGTTVWVELKSPGKKPNQTQTYRMTKLKEAGALVTWGDNFVGVTNTLKHYQP